MATRSTENSPMPRPGKDTVVLIGFPFRSHRDQSVASVGRMTDRVY